MVLSTPSSPRLPSGLHMLVATPHRDFAYALTAMLRALGAKSVASAHERETVRKLIKTTSFDALILDGALDMDGGVSLTRDMRTSGAGLNTTVPVIMISASADKAFIEAARDAGIHEFIRMPVSGDILYSRLRTALERPREFIAEQSYAGPDRRRTRLSYKGPERRTARHKAAS